MMYRVLTVVVALVFFQSTAWSQDAHSPHAKVKPGIDPATALTYLKNGNKRFLNASTRRKDGDKAADLERLSTGQQPHTIVVSCSDSRVPPELVFDQKLGEIFVVRVAGEAIDSSVLASVEYAAEHLGSKLVVVMGHTECGAVKAALGTKVGASAGSPSLDKLVADIRPRIASDRTPASEPSPHFKLESAANAQGVATQMVERSPILKHLAKEGKIKVVPSLYHLDTGKVEFYE